ncbi:proteasome assembly chaperone 1-like isoform X2 [Hoplias malabaricus]|uniref:proteasome assembly chaperone 1-like isoform X2 n=1 Tax=Hoplias malabaricus TaxID=27720 RepID=UPI0034626FE0
MKGGYMWSQARFLFASVHLTLLKTSCSSGQKRCWAAFRGETSVTLLSDSPLAEYKTPEYLNGSSAPFLRALKTSTYTGSLPCPLLEQPNIIAGLPAAVLSHCQVHRIPAVLFQCFTDVVHLVSVTMETYKPASSCLSTSVKLEACPSVEILQKLTRIYDALSNLYI